MQEIIPDSTARGVSTFAASMSGPIGSIMGNNDSSADVKMSETPNPSPQPLTSSSIPPSISASMPPPISTFVSSPSASMAPSHAPSWHIPPPKRSFSEMMEEPENMSTDNLNTLPFSQVSQIHIESAKRIDLGAAVNTARSRSNTHKPVVSNTAVESLTLGLQGTLNVLSTSINKLVSQLPATLSDDTAQVGATQPPSLQEQALRILKDQDDDLARPTKAFICSQIAGDPGFTEVYVLTVDKEEQCDYVMHEYSIKTGRSGGGIMPK